MGTGFRHLRVCTWVARLMRGLTGLVAWAHSTYPTSYEALVGRAQTKAGEWVLVHAAAGGVGMAAVQIAKGTSLFLRPEVNIAERRMCSLSTRMQGHRYSLYRRQEADL